MPVSQTHLPEALTESDRCAASMFVPTLCEPYSKWLYLRYPMAAKMQVNNRREGEWRRERAVQTSTKTHCVCPNCGAEAAGRHPICAQCGHLTNEKVTRIPDRDRAG